MERRVEVMKKDYVGIAEQYAEAVVAGEVLACEFVIQACERQLDDLEQEGFPYTFDDERAIKVCRFAELMPHVKGEWARPKPGVSRPLIELEPWQVFVLSTVFGWVDDKGFRRFKTAYLEIPRKNAKSTLLSAIGNYLTAADGEPGANVFSAATTRDQAGLVFEDAKTMAKLSDGYRRRFGVTTTAKAIVQESTGSFFKAVSADANTLDGLSVSGGIVDELHAHKTRKVWDVLETATGARSQPLLMAITTAGSNRTGICYEQRDYVKKTLARAIEDEEYFGIIYTVDDADLEDRGRLLNTPELWAKANPNYGVSVNPGDLARKARKALQLVSAQNNFLTKHLNVWVNADTAWVSVLEWDQCEDLTLAIEDFEAQECVMGLDLASKLDIMSQVYTFQKWIDGKRHIYVFGDHYLPERAVEESSNSQYVGWEEEGRFIVSPGTVNDFSLLEDNIKAAVSRFDMRDIVYDPTQATQLSTRMHGEGIEMEEMRQSVANFSESMKELEAMIYDRRVHHNGCPVLAWMLSNVVCHTNAKDEVYPRKETEANKIDGIVALIMTMRKWIEIKEEPPQNVFTDRGARQL